MATADEALAAPPASPLQQMAQNFSKLSQRQKLAGAGALAFAIALLVGVWLWSSKPDYQVLFSNLEERDGGAIVTALQQQNVPYTFSEGGGAILVPGNMVHEVRLRLAAEGLPRGGLVGFELMENQKLGLSQFNEQVNFQRALEGELSRTVQAIATVSSARVHLAIPKQTAFLRDEQKPTASVFVNLYPGRVLEPAQVAGVVHLVASSVPQLSPDLVSIVDQSGKLLTQKSDPLRAAGLDPTQLKYVDELEKSYSERINTILLPLVGEGNFRAQVTADVDFDQTEQTADLLDGKAEFPRAEDEAQTHQVFLVVQTIARHRARRIRQHPNLFVVADRLDVAARAIREFSALEGRRRSLRRHVQGLLTL